MKAWAKQLALIALLLASILDFSANATTVEIRNKKLYVNGSEYFIKGAACNGDNRDSQNKGEFWYSVVDKGGNTLRTYTANDLSVYKDVTIQTLDDFASRGLYVMFGLSIQRECDGFDYSAANEAARKEQIRASKSAVDKYKNHPAILMWCVGNEVDQDNKSDGSGKLTLNVNVWRDINEIAQYIREVDGRPVSTAITSTWSKTLNEILTYVPSVNVLSINAYDPFIDTVHSSLKEQNFPLPYIISEFGPKGTWEADIPRTSWGGMIEETSTEKATDYRTMYRNDIEAHRNDGCLGSFVFLWGYQSHGDVLTWYAMYDQFHKQAFESVDAMTELWTGASPQNHAPVIASNDDLRVNGLAAGSNIILRTCNVGNIAEVTATDPDGDALTYEWRIIKDERLPYSTLMPEGIPGLIDDPTLKRISFKSPTEAGKYRLMVFVRDNANNKVAMAVAPLLNVQEENPACLYVIGKNVNNCQPGNDLHDYFNYYRMYPVSDGVYQGEFVLEADEFVVRFQKNLEDGWDHTIGAATANGIDAANVNTLPMNSEGKLSDKCGNTAYNWKVSNWNGGTVRITVNLNTMWVHFETVEQHSYPARLFVYGKCNGYKSPTMSEWNTYKNWVIHQVAGQPGVYEGMLPISSDCFVLDFINRPFGWEKLHTYGAPNQTEYNALNIKLTDGRYTGSTIVDSPYYWKIDGWKNSTAKLRVDLTKSTVEFSQYTIPITTPEGYSPYYSGSSYYMPDGLTGATAEINGTTLHWNWQYAAGDLVPAHTPLLLHGYDGICNYPVELTLDEGTAPTENQLYANPGTSAVQASGIVKASKYYRFGYHPITSELGFCWQTDNGASFPVDSREVFLVIPQTNGGTPFIDFSDNGNVTSVETIKTDGNAQDTMLYNVLGQPVGNDYKGFVIAKGKKAIKR